MSTQHHDEEAIFHIARKMETDDRAVYLEQVCGDDRARRARVEALLVAHDREEAFLEPAMPGAAETIERSPLTEKPGASIGPYKLLEQIGEGGMGVVYMAEQQKPLRRKVALKIIKPGMDTKQVIARFEAERQALALMDHPNIAHVLDAGGTESGRPFFVMELVRGIPITEYCNQNKLKTRERLRLFVSVCQAVQHAHTKGIIHRDLKPTNVLVTLHDGVPVPKIIDFGVAKATNQQLTEKTLFTSFAQMVGTPLYMSPEQAEMSGLDVDTRSDIYSLGVLLYELLTGTTPFDRKRINTASYDEVRRIIREEEPARPSMRLSTLGDTLATVSAQRGTDSKKLRQQLRGELDWIVMKTLEKDRTRRYETASALANEMTRYLNGETVKACPPSTTYRVRKLIQRHKARASIAIGFLLLLLASSGVAWILYAYARQARNEALTAQAGLTVERDRAFEAEAAAEKNRQRAEEQKDRATAEKTRADDYADELKRRLYDYNLIKAERAYRDNDTSRVLDLLEDCFEEQRGWEWRHLHRLAEADRTLELAGPPITCFALSPDSSRLVGGDNSGDLRLFDLISGKEIWSSHTGNKVTMWVAFSPDGDLVASSSLQTRLQDLEKGEMSGSLQLWEAATGKKKWEATIAGGFFVAPSFSLDGQHIAAIGGNPIERNSFVELWSVATGEQVWKAPGNGLGMLAFAPDGKHLYLSETYALDPNRPSTLRCLTVADHKETWSVERSAASYVTSSPDGTRLVTGGANHSLQVWDAATGEQIEHLQGPHTDYAVYADFSPDGKHLASLGLNGNVVLWDWPARKIQKSLRAAGGEPRIMEFSADGKHLISAGGGMGSTVRFWEVDPLPPVMTLLGHERLVKTVTFRPDHEQLLSVSSDGTLRVWDTFTGQELRTITIDRLAYAVATAGNYTATGGPGGVKLWDARTDELIHHWSGAGEVWWIRFSHDGEQVFAADNKGVIRRWNTRDGKELRRFDHKERVDGIALSPDGRHLVSLLQNIGQLTVWDVESGTSEVVRPAGSLHARCIAFRPDTNIVAAGIGQTVELWDIDTKQNLITLRGHNRDIYSLTFNTDGSRLFAGNVDGMIEVWNVDTGEQLFSTQGHEGEVWSLALSGDGKTLATAGNDGLVKLWETTRPSADKIEQRRIVSAATQIVNQRYGQSPSVRDVLASLTADKSLDRRVLAVALEIANARGDRPRASLTVSSQQALSKTAMTGIRENLDAARASLIEMLETAAGANFSAAAEGSVQSVPAGQWYTSASRLADPRRSPIPPRELLALLSPLVESYPRVHQIAYVRGLIQARRGRWQEADVDFTKALSLAPEKTALWHEYAYRLAYLLAYTGQLDRYGELCRKTLADFGDTDETGLAERTAKMCLFSKEVRVDVEKAGKLVDRAYAAGPNPAWLKPYLSLAKGIADFRREEFATAVETLETTADQFRAANLVSLNTVATNMYLAMAYERTGQHEKARQTLEVAAKFMNLVAAPDADDFPGWNDWMVVQMARDEAEALIGGKDELP